MAKKLEVTEAKEEVSPREYLENQLKEYESLYSSMNKHGIRSVSDLEVKISYLQRDIQNLN